MQLGNGARTAHPAHPSHEPDERLGRLLRDFTALAGQICETPIVMVSQLHGHFDTRPPLASDQPYAAGIFERCQWWRFPGQSEVVRSNNDFSLCEAATVTSAALTEIGDLGSHAGFAGAPMVTGMPGVRFYAAAIFGQPQGNFMGTLCVLDRRARSLLPGQRMGLLTLARQLEERLALHHEVAQLQCQVLTDALTGIGNRRAFDQRLGDESARHQRSRQPLSLLMIDVNFFKQYNDAHGHPAGDVALINIAQLLCIPLRGSDFVARYGGDEFAIILPETPEGGAHLAAERIHETLRNASWPHGEITLSIGIATLMPEEISDAQLLLQRADQAMYTFKRHC
ncbi:GGDEF domain-containing protein [Herbaspirillum lusitanum]|uniref:diguanylate cyclase n=1 Tax=Herbaspirillum lusitanum TaxID=213312 RepID=A0ABW9A7X8_9BURK